MAKNDHTFASLLALTCYDLKPNCFSYSFVPLFSRVYDFRSYSAAQIGVGQQGGGRGIALRHYSADPQRHRQHGSLVQRHRRDTSLQVTTFFSLPSLRFTGSRVKTSPSRVREGFNIKPAVDAIVLRSHLEISRVKPPK